MTEPKTKTLAAIYYAQGHLAEALDIYARILSDDPSDAEAQKRHDAIRREMRASGTLAEVSTQVKTLRRLLRRVQRRRKR